MALIAKIKVSALVEGVRKEFAPGEPVEGLQEHDIASLIEMGALEDERLSRIAQQKHASEVEKADREFQAARQRVKAEQQTRASDAPTAGDKPQASGSANAGGTSVASDIGLLAQGVAGNPPASTATDVAAKPTTKSAAKTSTRNPRQNARKTT